MSIDSSAIRRFFYDQIWRRIKLLWLLIRAYAFNLFVAVDILINAIIGGDPGETISSRAGKGMLKRQPVHTAIARVIDLIFKVLFNQDDHCVRSVQGDEGKNAISEVIDRYEAGDKEMWGL